MSAHIIREDVAARHSIAAGDLALEAPVGVRRGEEEGRCRGQRARPHPLLARAAVSQPLTSICAPEADTNQPSPRVLWTVPVDCSGAVPQPKTGLPPTKCHLVLRHRPPHAVSRLTAETHDADRE